MHGSPVEDAAFGIDTACKAERMRLKDGAVGQLISFKNAPRGDLFPYSRANITPSG